MKTQDMMDVVRVPSSDADTPSIAPVRPPREQPRAAMVGWYHPVQLVRTALSIATSSIIGRNVDQRELEALHERTLDYFDYSLDDAGQPRRDLWLDFVADTGDGFDSTYAVASAVARDSLDVADPTGATHATQRGRILVFGGDLVYPVASREQYEQRTVMPYEHALPHSSAPHPDVFAIPGNHDWYDSLISFTRRFCSERWFAGWRTRQHVSYFALQLPHDWWLIGTDVQLDSDIDADQVRYFRAIAKKLTPRSRIILCNAEPHWIYEKIHDQDRRYLGRNLNFLEEKVFQRRIAVYLSGDLHHYRRHSDGQHHHKIVAGGGGAFLHPTHDVDVASLPAAALPGCPAPAPYVLRESYPDVATSRALTRRNLLFPLLNWRFGLVTGLLYLLTCRAVPIDVTGLGIGDLATVANRVVCEVLRGPTALLWVALVIVGVVLYTDPNSLKFRILGGAAHALTHLLAVFFLGWGTAWLVAGWKVPLVIDLLAFSALVFAAGWIVGSLVLGIYLFVSLNGFGRHGNEAFSALAVPDFKNFLRLHIDGQGTLRIYPIGIDRVPRRWKSAATGPRLVSGDPAATPPRLIEPPIAIPGPSVRPMAVV